MAHKQAVPQTFLLTSFCNHRSCIMIDGRVVSLGMFIIDRFEDGSEEVRQRLAALTKIGGGGVFAMVSARMFLPAERVGLIVDVGTDFPDVVRSQLRSYGDDMIWFRKRNGPTTRALNEYSGGTRGIGHQSFQYLTPKVQLWPRDVFDHWSNVSVIHMVCSTGRAREMVREMDDIVANSAVPLQRPLLVWEPLPLACVPEELAAFAELGPRMAVISPNLLEAQTLLGLSVAHTRQANQVAADALEALCKTKVVVRAGELGSFADGWVPAYWSIEQQHRVVDPTGGGNSFLGGLCAGLSLTRDLTTSAIYGSAAASFVIQQHGLPHYDDGKWNGEDPMDRVREIERATSRYTRSPTTRNET